MAAVVMTSFNEMFRASQVLLSFFDFDKNSQCNNKKRSDLIIRHFSFVYLNFNIPKLCPDHLNGSAKRRPGSQYGQFVVSGVLFMTACFCHISGLQRTNAMKCFIMQMLTMTEISITWNSPRS